MSSVRLGKLHLNVQKSHCFSLTKETLLLLTARPNTALEGNIAGLASGDCLQFMWIKACGLGGSGGVTSSGWKRKQTGSENKGTGRVVEEKTSKIN